MNESENTTTENLWDSVKGVLRRRFREIQAYLTKQEKNQMKNPRVSRRKEIIKIRAEINEKRNNRDHSKNQQN